MPPSVEAAGPSENAGTARRAAPDQARQGRTRPQRKDEWMFTKPRFLQGIVTFEGKGLDEPVPLGDAFAYTVPGGMTAQPLYFRGGNSTNQLICVVLVRDGAPMRYFPIGATDTVHVPLRVVEDLAADTVIELHLAAPVGLAGTVVVDLGLVEI